MNRRDFIESSFHLAGQIGLGSLASYILSRQRLRADALPALQANLIIVRMHGAFDCIAGINPWVINSPSESDLFMTYDPSKPGVPGENTVLKNVNGTDINLGPAAHSLAAYAKQMAVIKGIWMGPADIGHPFAMQYISSGRSQEKAPHFSALAASSRQSQNQFLILNSPIEQGNLNVKIMQTLNLKNNFKNLFSEIDSYISLYKSDQEHIANYRTLQKNQQKMEVFNQILKNINSSSTPKDEDLVVAAFAADLASVAQIDIGSTEGGNVDNHIQYEAEHTKNQKNRWDRVAKLLENLTNNNLLDKTLVVVLTEFSRTPALNSNQGKDHNYFDNAMALFGYGIKGGSTIGGHALFGANNKREISQLSGQFIDYESGEIFDSLLKPEIKDESKIPDGVDLIRPSNALETVAKIILPDSPSPFGNQARALTKIMSQS